MTSTSFAPVFEFTDQDDATNAQRFATYEEAEASALGRWMRWAQPTGYHVEETNDAPNYQHIDGEDSPL